MSIAARKGAGFAAGGGTLSGCEMGRELELFVIAMARKGEWTDRPLSETRRARMNCRRDEIASSLKFCCASVAASSVHK